MKKIVALALSVVMVLACFCVFAVADDEAVKIPVYKINPEYYYEGCVAIYTHERGDVLGQEGQNFAWWNVRVFDYDEATGGYKCTEVLPGDGTDKTNTAIPENGFVLGANGGNNWPQLFSEATGSEWYYNESNNEGIPYKDCPNYNTEHVIAALALIANVNVGDIYYLDGISLDNADLNTNEDGETIFYYSDNFVSNAFLSSVKPDKAVVEEPSKEDPKPVEDNKNILAGAQYTVEGTTRDDGYGDTNDDGTCKYRLTDGTWADGTVDYCAGYDSAAKITFDLGEVKRLSGIKFDAYAGAWGIALPTSAEVLISDDGENFTSLKAFNVEDCVASTDGWTVYNFEVTDVFSARYIRIDYEGSHTWISEVEAYAAKAEAPADESKGSTEPTSDSGIVALAVIAAIAVAGAVVVKKTR